MGFRIASEKKKKKKKKLFRIASDLGVRFESHRTSRLHRAIRATKGTRIEHKLFFFSSFSGPSGMSLQKSRDTPPEDIRTKKFMFGFKAFSPKKGLVFAVNGASAPLPPPPPNSPYTPLALPPLPPPLLGDPPPPGIFSKTPPGERGGGGEGPGVGGGGGEGPGVGGGGGWRGPVYRENEPLFRRKRLVPFLP